MNLYEYQGKQLFGRYNIPVPEGYVVENKDELKKYEHPVVVKSQILLGGRGKSGGIKFARKPEDLAPAVSELLGSKIRDYTVKQLLIEQMLDIKKEYYVSIALNRADRAPVMIVSPSGGVEIESVPDDKIFRKNIDPLLGYSAFLGKEASSFMGFDKDLAAQFSKILQQMYQLFIEYDCELVEINPLVQTGDGKLIAADSKVVVDNDSLFRHKDLNNEDPEKTPLEREANEKGYAFVELDGKIGVIANGAGLTMATLDALTLHNGKPRNFLDLGGTDSTEIVVDAFDLVLKAKPQAILVNIFGGVTKCDTVAAGIVEAKKKYNIKQPMVVRLSGVREEEGRKILTDNGIDAFSEMMKAIEKVVTYVKVK